MLFYYFIKSYIIHVSVYMYVFNQVMPLKLKCSHQSQGLATPQWQEAYETSTYLCGAAQGTPVTTQDAAVTFACLSLAEGNALWLKAPNTWAQESEYSSWNPSKLTSFLQHGFSSTRK